VRIEVLSPGNAVTDLRDKLQAFRVASIAHYLVVDPDKRIVIHHARGAGDVVATRIAGGHGAARPAGDRDHGGEILRVARSLVVSAAGDKRNSALHAGVADDAKKVGAKERAQSCEHCLFI
jgi:Putative restriction endonuclease